MRRAGIARVGVRRVAVRRAGVGLAVLLAGGGVDDPPASVGVASVAVTAPAAPVDVGATATLTAVVTGTDGRPLTGRPVTWTTETPAVRSVTPAGVVITRAAGLGILTATVDGVRGQAGVLVQ